MEQYSSRLEIVPQQPKFLERFISFFRTRVGALVSSTSLPATAGIALGSVAAGPVGAAIGGVVAGAPFALGGYDFGREIEDNIYQREPKVLSPWREQLKNIASSVVLKVNQLLENGMVTGFVTGATAGIATANPAIGLGAGIVGGVAGAVGGWNFGRTLQRNIRNENNVVSSAYPAMMHAGAQTVRFNGGV